jgi:hypothetical protein
VSRWFESTQHHTKAILLGGFFGFIFTPQIHFFKIRESVADGRSHVIDQIESLPTGKQALSTTLESNLIPTSKIT